MVVNQFTLRALIELNMASPKAYQQLIKSFEVSSAQQVDELLRATDKDTIFKHQLLANQTRDILDTLKRPNELLRELEETAE